MTRLVNLVIVVLFLYNEREDDEAETEDDERSETDGEPENQSVLFITFLPGNHRRDNHRSSVLRLSALPQRSLRRRRRRRRRFVT